MVDVRAEAPGSRRGPSRSTDAPRPSPSDGPTGHADSSAARPSRAAQAAPLWGKHIHTPPETRPPPPPPTCTANKHTFLEWFPHQEAEKSHPPPEQRLQWTCKPHPSISKALSFPKTTHSRQAGPAAEEGRQHIQTLRPPGWTSGPAHSIPICILIRTQAEIWVVPMAQESEKRQKAEDSWAGVAERMATNQPTLGWHIITPCFQAHRQTEATQHSPALTSSKLSPEAQTALPCLQLKRW